MAYLPDPKRRAPRDPAEVETVRLFTGEGHFWTGLLALALLRPRSVAAIFSALTVLAWHW